MDKPTIRSDISARLQRLDQTALRHKDDQITLKLLQLIAARRPSRVCCYRAMTTLHEVDTEPIISAINSYKNSELEIVAPHANASLPDSSFDLIIVPVVAFDNQFNRVGRGGGWYDKFLATQPHAYKVGLAYSEQLVDAIDIEPHDIALDTVLYA